MEMRKCEEDQIRSVQTGGQGSILKDTQREKRVLGAFEKEAETGETEK